METFLIKALQLILSLALLVTIHEFGHFLFARLFKIRVEKFYLFFDPWFSLFKFKPKNSDTEYGIGWLPLGGYVKIAGMIDESMDKEQMAQEPQSWEFRSKPAWQRLLVMVGGVLFNFILAIIIYSMILFAWGDTYTPYNSFKNGMAFSQSAKDLGGFQDHDVILLVDGQEMKGRGSISSANNTFMQFMDAKEAVVLREGKEMTLALPDDFGNKIFASDDVIPPFSPWMSLKVDSVYASAERIGMQKGDSIVSLNGVRLYSFIDLRAEAGKKDNRNKGVPITFIRNSVLYTGKVYIDSEGTIGIGTTSPVLDQKTDHYGFFTSFPAGAKYCVATLKGYITQIRFIFTKKGAESLGGFGAIGSMFPAQWDWYSFWNMTAFLSIILAFMNILPIPALDGGHIMFLLYEVITRRKPSEKFMEYAQITGMLLLLALLIYANGNDIYKFFFK